jgi:hypothetical protein
MKKNKINFLILLLLSSLSAISQPVIEPGSKDLNGTLLNKGLFDWAWYTDARGGLGRELGAEKLKVVSNGQNIVIVKHRKSKVKDINETDSLILNANTLSPIYRGYKGDEVNYYIQYGANLKGVRTILDSKKKESLSEAYDSKFFDKESLPFVVSCLPLQVGYEAEIPVVNYTSEFKPAFFRYRITETTEMQTISERSGVKNVWKVTVKERKQGHEYLIYVDKPTRRILRVDFSIPSALFTYNFFDKETDVNPIKAPFNAAETVAMLTNGNSGIKGQAYTKGYGKKLGPIANRTKQYAQKGSIVLLIPNTPYFKEWVDYNLKLSKLTGPVYTVDWGGMFGNQGESNKTTIGTFYPLPQEVSRCILLTKVTDDKGNFSYKNLKAGEYLLYVSFMADEYSHTTKDMVGQEIAISGDGYINSYPIWDVKNWTSEKTMKLSKFVTIKKEGETVDVLLK